MVEYCVFHALGTLNGRMLLLPSISNVGGMEVILKINVAIPSWDSTNIWLFCL